ncbi:MAG: BNR-4 repeat-containing protein [Nioella sp.]
MVENATMASGQPCFEVAADGVWTWFNDRRALLDEDGTLLVGYVRSDGDIAVTRMNLETGTRAEALLGTVATREVDDHNNPSLCVLHDKRVIAVYSRHGTDSRYHWRLSKGAQPVRDEDWEEERTRTVETRTTYANVVQLGGTNQPLMNFHRCLNWNPTISLSRDQGESWSDPVHFIQTGTGRTRPYVRLATNGRDRIDIFYTDGHPREVPENSIYHLYFQGGAFFRSDGTQVARMEELPIDHDAGEGGTLVYRDGTPLKTGGGPQAPTRHGGRAWIWDAGYDDAGNPVCVFQSRRGDVTGSGWEHDRIDYGYERWTGTTWTVVAVAKAGRPLYHKERDYGGGIVLDPRDGSRVFLSSNAKAPFDLSGEPEEALAPEARYSLYSAVVRKGTIPSARIRTPESGKIIRPFVASSGADAVLLWIEGDYRTYRDFSTRVMGFRL